VSVRTRSGWYLRSTACAVFIGIAIVTRIVDSWGAYKTSVMCIALVLTGITGWALSAGVYPLMAFSVAIWGLGFAATNSMQQVRLVSAAPELASGIGVAQYVGTLRGPGHWFCDRRTIVCARSLLRHRLCRHGLCRMGLSRWFPRAALRQREPRPPDKNLYRLLNVSLRFDATRVSAGVDAILSRTSPDGVAFQAWVT